MDDCCQSRAIGPMDVFSPDQRSDIMRAVGSVDTEAEMAVRKLVHLLGYRYRLHRKDLPGRPDLAFPGRRKAIFVHGCFWHQHPGCKHAAIPASNVEYWLRKFKRNVARDQSNVAALAEMGWASLVIWECELRDHVHLVGHIKDFLDGL